MMFKNITYKNRNKLLWISTLVFVVLAYILAIEKTLGLYEYNSSIKRKISQAQNAPEQIALLEKEANTLESTFKYFTTTQDLQGDILKAFTQACEKNNVLFKNFLKTSSHSKDDIDVETHEIIIQGKFVDLVQVCHDLENEINFGKIVSMKLQIEQDVRTKEEHLLAYFYIHSVKKNSGNE